VTLYQQTWRDTKQYNPLKRFFKIYIRDFDGAPEIRLKLMETQNYQQALDLLQTYL